MSDLLFYPFAQILAHFYKYLSIIFILIITIIITIFVILHIRHKLLLQNPLKPLHPLPRIFSPNNLLIHNTDKIRIETITINLTFTNLSILYLECNLHQPPYKLTLDNIFKIWALAV
jgi:hypothetical protein